MNKLKEDLKKYEAEIEAINKRLGEFDAQRQKLEEERQQVIVHGRRIEGIVAYIRATIEEMEKAEEAKKDENPADSKEDETAGKAEEGAAK